LQSFRRFVHVLLFKCPRCSEPVGVIEPNHQGNVEKIDQLHHSAQCPYCRWTGSLLGADAVRHWVADWVRTVAGDKSDEIQ
jgi:DNA-directed RNA polymerase subunit RPC12/RpoP